MAFTYVAPTTDRDKVRFLIGDTISADAAAFAKAEAARKAEAEAKATAKASALAKLAELGLTEEEAAAIAGA